MFAQEKIDILNPSFYATITEECLQQILRSDNDVEVPLLHERVQCLHEVGAVLLAKFNGSFETCVKQADHSVATLLDAIVTNFACFRDVAVYKGHPVAIYKRAQILIGDIWSCFKNEGLGRFEDIDEITMFADYRVPQALLYYDVFTYDDSLMGKLLANTVLTNGEEDEVAIRGCSIQAVELLKDYAFEKLKGQNKGINSILIDHFLWDFRRKHAKEISDMKLPFHKTFSIYY